MRMRIALFLIPLAWSAAGNAQTGGYGFSDAYEGAPRFAIDGQYRDVLLAIRAAALKQQAADGGRLSETHNAKIQARIDDARRAYRNALWRSYPSAVNPDGSLRQ